MMDAISAHENPYAPPSVLGSQDDARLLCAATKGMYRGMGWAGILYCLTFYPILLMDELAHPDTDTLMGLTYSIATLMFFVFMIRMSRRLESHFDGTYRIARWMGIVTATLFFPLFTVPGILALRRLERYRDFIGNRTPTASQ